MQIFFYSQTATLHTHNRTLLRERNVTGRISSDRTIPKPLNRCHNPPYSIVNAILSKRTFSTFALDYMLLWGKTDVRVRLWMRIREISLMPAYKHKHTLKIISPGLVKTLFRPHHMIKTLTRKKRSFTSTCLLRHKVLLNVSLYWKLQLHLYNSRSAIMQ